MAGNTCIFGSGPCARHVARELLFAGIDLIIATREEEKEDFSSFFGDKTPGRASMELFTKTVLDSCHRQNGCYELVLVKNGQKSLRSVSSVVIAESEVRTPNFALYGLTPASNVLHLSRLIETDVIAFYKQVNPNTKTVVFLTGLVKESNPVIFREIMELCLRLQTDANLRIYVITNNLKVSAEGLEDLHRKTKEAGVSVIKLTDTEPEILQAENSEVRITYMDEILGQPFMLRPDLVVVDETIEPSAYTQKLVKIFRLESDLNRFPQADNVHRLTVSTNRKGIFVAGPSRSIQGADDQILDAKNAAAAVLSMDTEDSRDFENEARIDTGLCVRCLTCYRICPFRAVDLNHRPSVLPDACQRCGICVAECPKGAIRLPGLSSEEIAAQIGVCAPAKTFVPSIVAFCCSRSGAEARKLAVCTGCVLPPGLTVIEVPCAGCISPDYLLSAFKNGVDGVLVLTCHEGNCHSEQGNVYARRRVELLTGLFSQIGFGKKRLMTRTLASNMGTAFADVANDFEKTLLALGPSKLKE